MPLRADMRPDEMKKLDFIRALPYHTLTAAHKIIDRGGDIALLYFWFNLIHGHYSPFAKIIDVNGLVEYYIAKHPDFKADILSWYETFKQISHANNNRPQATAA